MPQTCSSASAWCYERHTKPQHAESVGTALRTEVVPTAQSLIGSTRTLLCDLSHFYGLTDGQAGRTLSRRMQNLLKVGARRTTVVPPRLDVSEDTLL